MMKFFIVVVQLSLLFVFVSCSSSSAPSWFSSSSSGTSTPSTGSFERIHLLLARTVQLQSSSPPSDYSRRVTCDDPNILPYVENRITENGTLISTATSDCDVTIRAYTYQNTQINSVLSLSMTDG